MNVLDQHFGARPMLKCRGLIGTTQINVNPLAITMQWSSIFNVAYFLDVSSSSAADALAGPGTGAQVVTIVGLDADYCPQTEDVNMTGQTKLTTTKKFLRVFAAYVKTFGTGFKNAGDIYIIKSGTGGVYVAGVPPTLTSGCIKMVVGNNLGYSGLFTTPRGRKYRVAKVVPSDRAQAATVIIVAGTPADTDYKGPFENLKIDIGPGAFPVDLDGAWYIDEKTDIYVQSFAAAASGIVNCSIEFEQTVGPKGL